MDCALWIIFYCLRLAQGKTLNQVLTDPCCTPTFMLQVMRRYVVGQIVASKFSLHFRQHSPIQEVPDGVIPLDDQEESNRLLTWCPDSSVVNPPGSQQSKVQANTVSDQTVIEIKV